MKPLKNDCKRLFTRTFQKRTIIENTITIGALLSAVLLCSVQLNYLWRMYCRSIMSTLIASLALLSKHSKDKYRGNVLMVTIESRRFSTTFGGSIITKTRINRNLIIGITKYSSDVTGFKWKQSLVMQVSRTWNVNVSSHKQFIGINRFNFCSSKKPARIKWRDFIDNNSSRFP